MGRWGQQPAWLVDACLPDRTANRERGPGGGWLSTDVPDTRVLESLGRFLRLSLVGIFLSLQNARNHVKFHLGRTLQLVSRKWRENGLFPDLPEERSVT